MVKCLVWDLDNTLWRGTLAEGDAVRIPEATRELVAALDARGIIQSVASKNDHDHAWAKLVELGIAEYFVLPRIGWGAKSASVREIADKLRFAYGTVAFVDDQPAERAEVAYQLPDIRCYTAEQVAELAGRPEFSPATVTADSARRRQMYQASFERETAQAEFTGPDEEFLRSLRLEMRIERASEEQLARVEELTLRTSQMNATGVHYGHDDLRALLADPAHEVLVASMADRFGPHGAIGVLLLAKRPGVWHLKLLATSCRVVSFGAGTAIINWLIDQAARAGAHLVADFRPTDRNRMMDIAYRFAGFTDDACECVDGWPAGADGVQRLHLVADRRPAHATVALIAPELGAAEPGRR
jgi:methoxymalonate biosynthesis protein